MRKVIIPVGYMSSGSSAVTDLVSEYENVSNEYGSWEYVFLHCPNGLFDLEDKLLIGNNIIRSDEALHTFLKTMKDLYDKKYYWVGNYKKRVSPKFYERTVEFVESLIDDKEDTYWYYMENMNFPMFVKAVWRKLVYLVTFKKVKLPRPRLYPNMYLSYPTKEKFYALAKSYINDIINMIDNSKKDIVFDQLVLPYNLFRVDNYFDDNYYFIVVERDPRNVFIENKYATDGRHYDLGVPYSVDVKTFCKQYRRIREMEIPSNSKKILRIKFEDMIYKYEETKSKIEKFVGLDPKKRVKNVFKPEESYKNTRFFLDSRYEKEIKYIEKELKEYLYDFPE